MDWLDIEDKFSTLWNYILMITTCSHLVGVLMIVYIVSKQINFILFKNALLFKQSRQSVIKPQEMFVFPLYIELYHFKTVYLSPA